MVTSRTVGPSGRSLADDIPRMLVSAEDANAGEFEDFFREQAPVLIRALVLISGTRAEAEDVLQDSFLKVWMKWDRVRDLDDPVGYLYRISLNELRSRWRTALRRAKKIPVGLSLQSIPLDIVDLRDSIGLALSSLPRRQRFVFVLVEWLDWSFDRVAELTGVKASTIRSLASQARSRIRSELGGKDD